MQAITTKYLGPTNYRGARIKASCDAGTITIAWDHALNVTQNHHAACRALASKLAWLGDYVCGGLGDSFVYVCVTRCDGAMMPTHHYDVIQVSK